MYTFTSDQVARLQEAARKCRLSGHTDSSVLLIDKVVQELKNESPHLFFGEYEQKSIEHYPYPNWR